LLPCGAEVGIRLDPTIAARGNQLGQHVGDFPWASCIMAPLLAPAASDEVGGGVIGGLDLQSYGF